MKFSTPKKQKGRPGYGWRTLEIDSYEEKGLSHLYPKFKRSGSASTLKEANEYLYRVRTEVEALAHDLRLGRAMLDRRTWDEHVSEYLNHGQNIGGLKDTKWSPETLEMRTRMLRDIWKPLLNPKTLHDVRRDEVLKIVVRWRGEGLAPSTINSRLEPIRGMMRRAEQLSYIAKSPLHGLYLQKRVLNPRGHFTPQELRVLFTETPLDDSLAYQLAYYCRYREAEIRKLTVGSINWIERTINLSGMLSEDKPGTKNKNDASQAIPSRLWEALWDYCAGRDGSEPLLKYFSPNHPERRLYVHMDRLGLPRKHKNLPRSFHSFGHSTATNALKAGVRLEVVRAHMRHASIDQTLEYVTKEMEEAQSAVELMDFQIFPEKIQSKNHRSDTGVDAMKATILKHNNLEGLMAEGVGFRHTSGKPSKSRKSNVLALHPQRTPPVSYKKGLAVATQALHKLNESPEFSELLPKFLSLDPSEARRLLGRVAVKHKGSRA